MLTNYGMAYYWSPHPSREPGFISVDVYDSDAATYDMILIALKSPKTWKKFIVFAHCLQVKQIVEVFNTALSYNCKSNGDVTKHEEIVMALKALGNTGNFGTKTSQTLVRCFQNDAEPMEIRVAAVQAFRRMPCTPEVCV